MLGLSLIGRLPRLSGAEVKRTRPPEPGRLIGNAYRERVLRVMRYSALQDLSNACAYRCSLSTGADTNCESERGTRRNPQGGTVGAVVDLHRSQGGNHPARLHLATGGNLLDRAPVGVGLSPSRAATSQGSRGTSTGPNSPRSGSLSW